MQKGEHGNVMNMMKELFKGAPNKGVKGLVRRRAYFPLAKLGSFRVFLRNASTKNEVDLPVMAVRGGCTGRVAHGSVAVVVGIMAVTVYGTSSRASQAPLGSGRRLDALGRTIDTVQTERRTAFAAGQMAGASGLATVAGETSLLDAAARKGDMPGISVGLVVGAGKAEPLAIGAHGADAVASDLAMAACRAGRRRLLRATVLRRGNGSDRGSTGRVEASIRHGPHMAAGMKCVRRRESDGNVHRLRRCVSWSSNGQTDRRERHRGAEGLECRNIGGVS